MICSHIFGLCLILILGRFDYVSQRYLIDFYVKFSFLIIILFCEMSVNGLLMLGISIWQSLHSGLNVQVKASCVNIGLHMESVHSIIHPNMMMMI